MTKAISQTAMKLQRDPFSAEPDLGFYFAYEAFEQRLALLSRLLQGKDALIVVLGEAGSGKTMLLKCFLDTVASPWRSGRIRSRSNGSAKLQHLDKHPAFIVKDARDPIILLDDAHELSRIELRYLLKEALAPGSSTKIKRLVLFAEPEFTVALAAMSDDLMGQAAVNKIFMPPLGPEESGNYLLHRLLAAGYAGKNPFSAKVVKKLHRLSDGIPGRLNAAAANWLEKGGVTASAGRGALGRFLSPKWLAGAAVVLGMILLAVFLLKREPPPTEGLKTGETRNRNLIRAKIPIQKPAPAVSVPRARGDIVTSAAPSARTPSVQAPPAAPVSNLVKTAPPAARSAIPAPPVDQKRPTPPTTQGQTPGVREQGLQGEDWLLAQNPGHYTVQLMGVRKEASLKRFVAANPGLADFTLAYYQTSYRSDQWYPLLCGAYASAEEARSAIQKLPADIRKMSPWIRKLSIIQTDIRKQTP